MCLVARHLEAHGIPTVCLGAARDIMLAGRPPRGVFVNYPLGQSAGKAFDKVDQLSVVTAALSAFSSINEPGQLVILANAWGDDAWQTAAGSPRGDDSRQPRDESPQFQMPADREAALASGALA